MYIKEFFAQSHLKAICQLVVQIAHQFPFVQKEIIKMLLSTFPH